MTFAHAEKDDLPATSPLKVYLAIAYGNVHEYFVESIDKWNQKNGNSYGKLEVVSDLNQADISVVVAREADTMVTVLPAGPVNGSTGNTGVLNYELCATVCFVVYSVACILWIRSNRLGNATHNAADQDCGALEDKLK